MGPSKPFLDQLLKRLAIALRSSGHEGLAFNLRQLFLQKKGTTKAHVEDVEH